MNNPFLLFTKSTWQGLYNLAKQSLISRIVTFFSCFTLIVWLGTGIFTWFEGKEYIDTLFDTQQILFAKSLAVMEFSPIVPELPNTKKLLAGHKTKGEEDDDALSFAIFSKEGEVLFTDGEDGEDFFFISDTLGFINVDIYDEDWRIFWIESLDTKRIIAVGQELDYRHDMILDILLGQLLPWISSLPLILFGLTWLLYKETLPLRRMTKNVSERKSDDFSPLDLESVSLEIRPLVMALNSLFVRTADLLEKERNFVANAAHELRTPLAGLAIQAEVISLSDDDVNTRNHALQKLLEGIKRSTRLIDQLLLLSSLENKKDIEKETSPALWDNLINQAIYEISDNLAENNIKINYTCLDTSIQTQQGELCAILLRNLLDNATRYSQYSDNEREIRICLHDKAIIIENSAKHLPDEVLAQLGQRFYRPAGQNIRGTGLGLAIVGHICQLQSFEFSIDNASKNEKKSYATFSTNMSLDGIVTAIIF